MLFFGFERYTILSHAVCKKSLNWWIFVIQGCVDHGWNPFFIYKNRSVPLIGGPCKKMIYFLNLLRTSHRFEYIDHAAEHGLDLLSFQAWLNVFEWFPLFLNSTFSCDGEEWRTELKWIDNQDTINTFRLYFMMMTIERKMKFWKKK